MYKVYSILHISVLHIYKVYTHILHMLSLTPKASCKAGITVCFRKFGNSERLSKLPHDKGLDGVKITLKPELPLPAGPVEATPHSLACET